MSIDGHVGAELHSENSRHSKKKEESTTAGSK